MHRSAPSPPAASTRTALADDAYIARAIREPDADVLLGFPRGVMPRFELDDEDVASIARAIEALSVPEAASPFAPTPAPVPQASTTAIPLLAGYGAWFVGLHLLLSSAKLRKRLVAKLGVRRFSALYSVCAAIGLIGMIVSYRSAPVRRGLVASTRAPLGAGARHADLRSSS